MGGEIGLMLGASLLTFVEFIDLFLFLIYHQLLRLNKVKKEKESQNPDGPVKKKSIRESIFGKRDSIPDSSGKRKSKESILSKKGSLGALIPSMKSTVPENEVKKRNGKIPWLDNIKSVPRQDPELGNLNVSRDLTSKPLIDVISSVPSSSTTHPSTLLQTLTDVRPPKSSRANGLLLSSPLRRTNGNLPERQDGSVSPRYRPKYSELGYEEGNPKQKPLPDRETYI